MAKKEEAVLGRRLKTSYISTVVSITLVLFVLGLLGLVMLHARKLSDHVKENLGFSVILHDNAKPAEINHLQKTLDGMPAVKTTEYVSSELAAETLMEDLGEDFVEFLGYNPLFPSIEVRLIANYANPDSLVLFEGEVMKNRIVREVHYQKDLVSSINENVKKIGLGLLVFSLLLLAIAFALINNTIRLSVFSKRFLIKSMQLVGATQSFIRKPFIIKGMIQGLIGATLAILLLLGLLYGGQRQIPELITFQDTRMLLSLFLMVILLGIVISWISTHLAVKKYLRIKTDYLYLY
ncbi:MAG: permease-like cell division protein FtsX [Bacteroidales bacterium]|jgi:cell division transport system permease protein|nr:permease-like cell division protein FtsX [Bacteroidales bacterium]NLM92588.1 cell division protein FtsX [Bacteroidales bacterium]